MNSAVYSIFKQCNEMKSKKENEIKETIEIDGIPIQDYGTVNSRTVYPAEIQIGETIKSNIDYWRNLYFEEKEKNKELLKEYNNKLGADWEDAISKDVLREKFEKLNKATKGESFLQEYMIFGNSGRATGWFINLDFIEKVIFNEPGYILKED